MATLNGPVFALETTIVADGGVPPPPPVPMLPPPHPTARAREAHIAPNLTILMTRDSIPEISRFPPVVSRVSPPLFRASPVTAGWHSNRNRSATTIKTFWHSERSRSASDGNRGTCCSLSLGEAQPPLPLNHLPQNLLHHLRCHRRRHIRDIPHGVELHQIRSYDFPLNCMQMSNRFAHRHPSRFA